MSEYYGHVSFLAADEPFGLFRSRGSRGDGEVFRCRQAIDDRLGLMIHLRAHHDGAHIPNIGCDGEAEKQHQHDRHAEEDEHGTLVAQDMAGFLDDK